MLWLLLDILCGAAIGLLLAFGKEETLAIRGITVLVLCGFGTFCLIKTVISFFGWVLAQ